MKMYDHQEEFYRLNNDVARWKWLQQNPEKYEVVMLDNDDTFVVFGYDYLDESVTGDIMSYVGWSDGVLDLLEAMGIEAERV